MAAAHQGKVEVPYAGRDSWQNLVGDDVPIRFKNKDECPHGDYKPWVDKGICPDCGEYMGG